MNAVRVAGFEYVLRLLNPERIAALETKLMQRIVLRVEAHVKRVTPVKTGNLKRSITSRVQSPTRGVVGTNVSYAPTVNRRNPFMLNGYANSKPEIQAEIAKAAIAFWKA